MVSVQRAPISKNRLGGRCFVRARGSCHGLGALTHGAVLIRKRNDRPALMGNNPLRNLSSEDIIKFLEENGFRHSNTKGDDAVYTSRDRKHFCLVTLNKRATPIGTALNIVRCSGIPKSQWLQWLGKNR
jgi:predicted RNA binding protein YcfA (HicA-like mRNA interferase family)